MEPKGKKPDKAIQLNSEEQLSRLGQRIKALRIEKGYSSYEYFAYEHGFSRAQYGRYEQGQDLRFSTLVRIVNAFGITFQDFFKEGFN
jgi:transcriptional regulator with XRE-family HTH domain